MDTYTHWSRSVGVAMVLLSSCLLGACTSLKPFDRFESEFENPEWKEIWNGKYFEETVQIQLAADRQFGFVPSNDGQGGRALRVTIAKGSQEGTHQLEYNFARHGFLDPEEATVRYLMRLAPDFLPEQGGKFPGFAGTYFQAGWGPRVSNGFNGWSTRGMFYPAPKGEPVRLASLCYLANMQERNGRSVFFDWNEKGLARLERNRWYEIVQHVRMNSVVNGRGVPDGVLRVWVDGQVAVDERTIVFRHTPDLKIDRMWFDVNLGGDPAKADMHVFFDGVVIGAGAPGQRTPSIRRR